MSAGAATMVIQAPSRSFAITMRALPKSSYLRSRSAGHGKFCPCPDGLRTLAILPGIAMAAERALLEKTKTR
jgi:hypothetical protein